MPEWRKIFAGDVRLFTWRHQVVGNLEPLSLLVMQTQGGFPIGLLILADSLVRTDPQPELPRPNRRSSPDVDPLDS
jgi:hypothetical protein